jgi:hypothetical protein
MMMRRLGIVPKEKVLENRGGILKHAVLERRVKGVVSTSSKKTTTLF